MISVNQLTVDFGKFELFKQISFLIENGDRIGLVGKNGAGKSTLLKIIAKLEQPTSGDISYFTDTTIGYLPQQMVYPSGKTVFEEAYTAFDEVIKANNRLDKLNQEISERTDYESDAYHKLIEEISHLTDRVHILGGHSIQADIEQTLMGLGFERTDFTRFTNEFSGGWRMRIELAKLILKKPSILLLDEPTNHLDIESIQWLEEFLSAYPGAVVLVSHDRAFLDAVTNRTIEISVGRIYDYKTSYSNYVQQREERLQQQQAAYENQQKMIQDTEKFIERFRYKATKAVQVQSRIKQLDKIERVEIDETDNSSIQFRFPPAPRSGTIVSEGIGVTKRYGQKLILDCIEYVIERGEKIAFVGRNGEGKTTLVKMILNETDYDGTIKLGHNVEIGYYAQNQDELLDESKTVFDTLDEIAVGPIRTKIRDILGAFLFSGETIDKKVKVLSGGERARLALAKLLLQPYSLLLLDEPTNHLDMRSKDILKQALMHYDGTIIMVSHDRDFLNGLTNKLFEFRNKKIKEFSGGIYEFLQAKKIANLRELEKKAPKSESQTKDSNISASKNQFLDKKEFDKKLRKVRNQISETENRISETENKIAQIEKLLNEGATHTTLFEQKPILEIYQYYQNLLTELMETWEQFHQELENLENG